MDDRQLLETRILSLQADLGKARRAIDDGVDDEMHRRMKVRFANLLTLRGADASELLARVRGGTALKRLWRDFALLTERCSPILQECLALLQGMLARRARLDDQICTIADTLLDKLSHDADIEWDRFTILADSEYTVDVADVVRVRFPEATIWDLPLAAHELGHFIGPRIRTKDESGEDVFPLKASLDRALAIDPQRWAFLHEYFGDVFATYTVGPMFGWVNIVLRFDPLSAFEREPPLARHPAAAKRVHLILETLRCMDVSRRPLNPLFDEEIVRLGEHWERSLAAVGGRRSLGVKAMRDVAKTQQELYEILVDNVPTLRYDGWRNASLLADKLWDEPPLPDDKTTIVDVLNAAWIARMSVPEAPVQSLRDLASNAGKICLALH